VIDIKNTWRMAALRSESALLRRPFKAPGYTCVFCQSARTSIRRFAASARQHQEIPSGGPFRTRLRTALRRTKIEWKPIPVALGIGFLGGVQFYRIQQREKRRKEEEDEEARIAEEERGDSRGRPKRRKRIRPSGPW